MVMSDQVMDAATQPKLLETIGKTFVIAYKESTDLLVQALSQEGIACEVLRQQHSEEYQDYSPSFCCLLNHQQAWERASQESQPTLIIEADFVPVIGFGQLPLPYNPQEEKVGIAWLYSCAAQIYHVTPDDFAIGFSVSTVAYIVSPQAANCLIELVEEIRQNPGPNVYSSWDSSLEEFLRNRHFKNYIPWRNYGEHGGLPNLEHYSRGLSKTHQADVLFGKLAFLPIYAESSPFKFFRVRLKARLKGMGRLVLGKFIRWAVVRGSSVPQRLIRFAVSRQATLQL